MSFYEDETLPELNAGIDLGTTFSSIAVWDDIRKEPVLLETQNGKEKIPSWVSFSEQHDTLVGYPAKTDVNARSTVYDVKRILGREYQEIQNKERWPFSIYRGEDGVSIDTFSARKDDFERFEPEEISGFILRKLYNFFKHQRQGYRMGNVVVTVPVDFRQDQREATKTACKLAGLPNVELVNEPTAAILEFKRLNPEAFKENREYNIIVIDFGGGTLDIACCKLKDNVVTIVKNGGNQSFGGIDFDEEVKKIIIEEVNNTDIGDTYYKQPGTGAGPNKISQYKRKMNKLKIQAEKAKEVLSKKSSYKVNLNELFEADMTENIETLINNGMEIEIYRSDFMRNIKPLIEKFKDILSTVSTGSNCTRDSIDYILPIGGTCKIPAIQAAIGIIFPKEKIIQTSDESNKYKTSNGFDSLTAVCKGACFYAQNCTEKSAKEVEVFDTIPENIGLKVRSEGRFFPLYKAMEPLVDNPIPKKVILKTLDINQKRAEFILYRGNYEFVDSGATIIGSISVDNLPDNDYIDFEFSMTINKEGIVDVEAVSIGDQTLRKHENFKMDLREIDKHFEEVHNHFKKYIPM